MTVQNRGFTRNSKKTARLQQWIPIAFILLLASALQFYQLGTESLWQDEVFSIRDAQKLPNQINIGRPLYYILLRFWMLFGTSDAWLRGLAVIFALGSVLLTYLLGRRLVGESTGLIAAFLLSTSPLFLNHAQQIRMYTLGTFLGVGGTLLLCYALERPRVSSMGWWVGARLLTMLTAPLNSALLFSDAVVVGWKFRSRPRLLFAFGVGFVLIAILWLPSFLSLTNQTSDFMSAWADQQPRPTAISFSGMLVRFVVWPLEAPWEALTQVYEWLFKAFAIVLTGLVGIALLLKQRSVQLGWIAVWAFLPQVAIFVASYLSSSLWVERYLLFTAPYALILLAAGLVKVWNRQRVVAIALALIFLFLIAGGLTHYYTTQHRYNWRAAVEMIRTNEKPGDRIVVAGNSSEVFFHYYQQESTRISSIERPPLDKTVERSDIEGMLERLPPIKSRLWLIYEHQAFVPQKRHQIFSSVVREEFNVGKYQEFTGIDVFLIARRSAPKRAEASSSHAQLQQPKPNSVGKIPVCVLPMLASTPEHNSPNADSW